MALQRVDRLKEPPVVGLYYFVPAIRWIWKPLPGTDPQDGKLWWPVIGHKHEDSEFFNFPHKHYHVDPRFMTRTHWSHVWNSVGGKILSVLASPLSTKELIEGPKPPQSRRMRCAKDVIEYPKWAAQQPTVTRLNQNFAGMRCVYGKHGWICPHRRVSLGSIKPIDGVITCFLHGLRIDAETGVCLGPSVQQHERSAA